MKLFLFDIDGTILKTRGVGRRAVAHALTRVIGSTAPFDAVSFSGKTDPQIFWEILDVVGVAETDRPALLPDLLDAYADRMRETLPEAEIHILPGVADLVADLHGRADVHLGLITGNLEPMAYLKLDRVGLSAYFEVGAFGSDSAHRPDLPAIAVERAAEMTGQSFSGPDVVIIGDTEHDILCGRGIGAVSVGVCTGHFTRDHLAGHCPYLLLDTLEDPDPLLALLA